MQKNNFQFLNYLNNNGLYLKMNILEEFLLTLKMDNIILLNGLKGTGKTSLLENYINYYNFQNNLNQKVTSTFKIGKTVTSKGFVVKRTDTENLIPHMKYEDEAYCSIDGIKVKGRLTILHRFFFKSSENDEFVNYLENKTDTEENITYDILLDDLKIDNHLYINADKIDKYTSRLESFIRKAKENTNIKFFMILDNINDDNLKKSLFLRDEIPLNLTIFYSGYVKNLSQYMNDMSVIKFTSISPFDYLQNNLVNVNLSDVEYLEAYHDERIIDINKIRDIIQNIYVEDNKSLYNTLIDELDNLYYILQDADIELSTQIINEILNYIIIGWKYENKPEIFENWKKYYDCQLTQRIIPLLNDKEMILDTIEQLINYCDNEYNYYRSFTILSKMI